MIFNFTIVNVKKNTDIEYRNCERPWRLDTQRRPRVSAIQPPLAAARSERNIDYKLLIISINETMKKKGYILWDLIYDCFRWFIALVTSILILLVYPLVCSRSSPGKYCLILRKNRSLSPAAQDRPLPYIWGVARDVLGHTKLDTLLDLRNFVFRQVWFLLNVM